MKDFLIKWAVNIIALLAAVHIVGGVNVNSWQTTVLAALVLGMLNAFLRPFFIMLTLPFNVLSLGFLTLVINGFIFYMAAKFVEGFRVAGFWNAFWAALVFSIVSSFINFMLAARAGAGFYNYKGGCYSRPEHSDVIDVEAEEDENGSQKRL